MLFRVESMGNNFWTTIAVLTNAILVSIIIWMVKVTNSDKGVLIFLFMYPVVLFGNVVVWLLLKSTSPSLAKRLKAIMLLMTIVAIPLIVWLSNF